MGQYGNFKISIIPKSWDRTEFIVHIVLRAIKMSHYQCHNHIKALIRGVVPYLLIRACANLMGSELVETEVLPYLVPESVPLAAILTEHVPSFDGVLLIGLQVEDPPTALLPGHLGRGQRGVHLFS